MTELEQDDMAVRAALAYTNIHKHILLYVWVLLLVQRLVPSLMRVLRCIYISIIACMLALAFIGRLLHMCASAYACAYTCLPISRHALLCTYLF